MPKFITDEEMAALESKGAVSVPSRSTIDIIRENVPKGFGDLPGKIAKETGRQALSFAHGAAEVINPLAIPRGLEVIGRTPFQSGGMLEKIQKASEKAVTPAPTVGEVAAAIRTPFTAVVDRKPLSEAFEKERAVQSEFESSLSTAGEVAGGAAAILPALWHLGKTIIKAGIKGAGKIPGVAGRLSKFSVEQGIKRGVGERLVEASVKYADRLPEFKAVGDRFLYKKAKDIASLVEDFKDYRNANYDNMIQPLLKAKGKMKVPIGDVKRAIRDSLGEETISRKLHKKLLMMTADFKDKNEIDFQKANALKQEIYKTFGGFKKSAYVGQTKDDVIAARVISSRLKDAIAETIPEVVPINEEYAKASNLLDSMNEIIGPMGPGGGFKKAQKGLERTMKVGEEELALAVDRFGDNFPQARSAIADYQAFLAAKKIYGGYKPNVALTAGKSGLFGRVIGAGQFLRDQPYERSVDLLGIMKRPVLTRSTPKSLEPLASGFGVLTRSNK